MGVDAKLSAGGRASEVRHRYLPIRCLPTFVVVS